MTVNVLAPVRPAKVASMVLDPEARAVAKPDVLIVATVVLDDAEVTKLVRFAVELAGEVPVAVNCSVKPLAKLGLTGVTVIDVSVAAADGGRRRSSDASEVASTVLAAAESRGQAVGIDRRRTDVIDDVHTTVLVRFAVEPSLQLLVAVNCSVKPLAMLGSVGVTAIDVKATGMTVNVVVPLTEPRLAVMIDEPVAKCSPVRSPRSSRPRSWLMPR